MAKKEDSEVINDGVSDEQVRFNMLFPKHIFSDLKEEGARRGRSVADIIRQLAFDFLYSSKENGK